MYTETRGGDVPMFRSIGAFLIIGALASCSPSTGGGSGPSVDNGGVTNGGFGGVGNSGAGGAINPGNGGSSNTGGGVVFIPTGGANGTSGAAGKDGGCGGYTRTGEIVPLDIYIMFDQSKSMACPIANGGPEDCSVPCRWNAVKAALISFVQNVGASTIDVGLGYFGTQPSPPGSSCLPKDYVQDVEIGPLSTNAQLIINSLNAHNPLTDTPTLPALQSLPYSRAISASLA